VDALDLHERVIDGQTASPASQPLMVAITSVS
jgi:hypothetical protein